MAVYLYELLKSNPAQYISMPKFDNIKREEFNVLSMKDYNRIG